jgi:hypothetical protein
VCGKERGTICGTETGRSDLPAAEAAERGSAVPGRTRAVSALLLVGVLVSFAMVSDRGNPFRPLEDIYADPERYDGRTVQLVLRIDRVLPSGFVLRDPADGSTVRVSSRAALDGTGVTEGDRGRRISVVGTFHREGVVDPDALYVARGRSKKIYVSLVAVVFVGFVVIRTFRIRWRRLEIVERGDA